MKKIELQGSLFRQSKNGPVQFSFVSPSCDIDSWARVPTKLERNSRGIQRPVLKNHRKEVASFFEEDKSEKNSSPTSILLGFDPEKTHLITFHDYTTEQEIDLDSVSIEPIICKCSIKFDTTLTEETPPGEEDNAIKKVFTYLQDDNYFNELRLEENDGGVDSGEDQEEDDSDEEDSDEEDSDEEDSDEEDEDQDDEERKFEEWLLRSTRLDIYKILNDESYKSWPTDRKRKLIKILYDDIKPGLIIDGQHRIEGTKQIGKYPFACILIPKAEWNELAFQFIVNNNTSKKVKPGLLIAIVGQSLNPEEVKATESRLYQVNIKVGLIQAVMKIDVEKNPFAGMLEFGIPGEKGFLEAPAMQNKIVSQWFGTNRNGSKPKFPTLQVLKKHDNAQEMWSFVEVFGSVCKGKSEKEKAKYWQENLWLEYFSAFWEAISEFYKPRIWPETQEDWPGINSDKDRQKEINKLMRITVLAPLQDAVLQNWYNRKRMRLEDDEKTFADIKIKPKDLKDDISKQIKILENDFFLDLNFSGFDGSTDIRNTFIDSMLKILSGQKKLAAVKKEKDWWS